MHDSVWNSRTYENPALILWSESWWIHRLILNQGGEKMFLKEGHHEMLCKDATFSLDLPFSLCTFFYLVTISTPSQQHTILSFSGSKQCNQITMDWCSDTRIKRIPLYLKELYWILFSQQHRSQKNVWILYWCCSIKYLKTYLECCSLTMNRLPFHIGTIIFSMSLNPLP